MFCFTSNENCHFYLEETVTTQNGLLIFLWKETQFRNKIMEIVEDFDEKKFQQQRLNPGNRRGLLRVNPFFLFSFFFHHFSPFFHFSFFTLFSCIFSFFVFFMFLHFLSFSFIFFHFLSFPPILLSFSFIFHFLSFSFII